MPSTLKDQLNLVILQLCKSALQGYEDSWARHIDVCKLQVTM
jgi:hypothetical protein